jgi:hypothetical protein
MAYGPTIPERIKFFWACVNPLNRWIAGAYAMLGLVTWCRDELLPAPWKKYHVLDLVPDWPLYLWIAIGLGICILSIGEGLFREVRLIEEAKTRSKPIFDLNGNPYQGARKERGLIGYASPVIILIGIGIAWMIFRPSAYKSEAVMAPQLEDIKKTSVAISCVPVSLPLHRELGQSLWTILLHPDANTETKYFTFVVKGLAWPHSRYQGYGYKCEFINDGSPISQLYLTLQVDFGDAAGTKRNRIIDFGFPWPHNDKPFELYLANCTAWSPQAEFPETGVAVMRGTNGRQKIYLERITKRMGGFGSFDAPQYPTTCGLQ